jgi:hypothetical protein
VIVHLSHAVGEVAERSDAGEGLAARTTLTRLVSLADLSREAGEVTYTSTP